MAPCGARAGGGLLLAVLPGLGDVPRVGVFSDGLAHLAVTVGGEEGPGLDEEAEAVVEGVALLWPVLREEAMAQRIVAHDVLDLRRTDSGTFHLAIIHVLIHSFNEQTVSAALSAP